MGCATTVAPFDAAIRPVRSADPSSTTRTGYPRAFTSATTRPIVAASLYAATTTHVVRGALRFGTDMNFCVAAECPAISRTNAPTKSSDYSRHQDKSAEYQDDSR